MSLVNITSYLTAPVQFHHKKAKSVNTRLVIVNESPTITNCHLHTFNSNFRNEKVKRLLSLIEYHHFLVCCFDLLYQIEKEEIRNSTRQQTFGGTKQEP